MDDFLEKSSLTAKPTSESHKSFLQFVTLTEVILLALSLLYHEYLLALTLNIPLLLLQVRVAHKHSRQFCSSPFLFKEWTEGKSLLFLMKVVILLIFIRLLLVAGVIAMEVLGYRHSEIIQGFGDW